VTAHRKKSLPNLYWNPLNPLPAIRNLVGNDTGEAMYSLYTADAVCFDVDSTVINEEGIDVLADFL